MEIDNDGKDLRSSLRVSDLIILVVGKNIRTRQNGLDRLVSYRTLLCTGTILVVPLSGVKHEGHSLTPIQASTSSFRILLYPHGEPI